MGGTEADTYTKPLLRQWGPCALRKRGGLRVRTAALDEAQVLTEFQLY